MKKLNQIIALLFFVFLSSTTMNGQEYFEQLNTVILSGHDSNDAQTYSWVNSELIEKERFKFHSEIKNAKAEAIQVAFPMEERTEIISKADYLKELRKAGNRSENAADFIEYLGNNLTIFSGTSTENPTLTELYKVIRSNTIEGKLDIIETNLAFY